jgi:hypothetical protein
MRFYDAVVRPGGSILMEIHKRVSAPEIYLLRHIHGPDAVLKIHAGKNDTRVSREDEYERMAQYYGEKVVQEVFGLPHNASRMPDRVSDDMDVPNDLEVVEMGEL